MKPWSAWVPWLRRKHPLSSPGRHRNVTVPLSPWETAGSALGGQAMPDPRRHPDPWWCSCPPFDHTEACYSRWLEVRPQLRHALGVGPEGGSRPILKAAGVARFGLPCGCSDCRAVAPRPSVPVAEPEQGETVQHCNTRTGYELIAHPYDPAGCDECKLCQDIALRSQGRL